MDLNLVFLIAFLVSYLSAPAVRKLAIKLEILDLPSRRKIHQIATPLLGGVAIYLGLLAGFLLYLNYLCFFLPVLLGATIVLGIGLLDDIRGLSAPFRLSCQILLSVIIFSFGIHIDFLPPGLWGDIGEAVITVLWIVGVTNAYNYLDGMDGLAAGSAVINFFCFAVILYSTKQFSLAAISIVLMGVCLGFIPHNFKKDKMFLGEAGSTLLGFILACVALIGSWAEDSVVKISIPILILGVPIFDMIFTTIMRIKDGKVKTVLQWLRYGGKDHFHHCLVDVGLRPLGAVIFIYFITFSLGLSAILISKDKATRALLVLLQAAIIFWIIATLIVVGKRRRSGWSIHGKNN